VKTTTRTFTLRLRSFELVHCAALRDIVSELLRRRRDNHFSSISGNNGYLFTVVF